MARSKPPHAQLSLLAIEPRPAQTEIAPAVVLLAGFAATLPLRPAIEAVARQAPFRQLQTPGGGTMSVAMTNCGAVGWHSDARGYRYTERDPQTGRAWPPMSDAFLGLAQRAAAAAGFAGFAPDCCLVNRYAVGAQMGTHRDYDELDLAHPIVSVSIGLPAVFVWHGTRRQGTALAVPLHDGDVLVWGGVARAGYHGVRRLRAAGSGDESQFRYNLTFRRAR
jgi:alkylated DNA repair protein (DNA oxidative demethylase)